MFGRRLYVGQVPGPAQPPLGEQGRERRDGSRERDQRAEPAPAEFDRSNQRDDAVGHKRSAVQSAKQPDASLGGLGDVLQVHPDEEAGPGDGLEDGDDDVGAADGGEASHGGPSGGWASAAAQYPRSTWVLR